MSELYQHRIICNKSTYLEAFAPEDTTLTTDGSVKRVSFALNIGMPFADYEWIYGSEAYVLLGEGDMVDIRFETCNCFPVDTIKNLLNKYPDAIWYSHFDDGAFGAFRFRMEEGEFIEEVILTPEYEEFYAFHTGYLYGEDSEFFKSLNDDDDLFWHFGVEKMDGWKKFLSGNMRKAYCGKSLGGLSRMALEIVESK